MNVGTQTLSLLASYDTINLSSVDAFSLSTGPWAWRSPQRTALRHLYAGGGMYAGLVEELSQGLAALYADLDVAG